MAAGEKLLTIKEVAELLGYGCNLNPVYMAVHRRQLPCYRLGQGKRILRFRLSDLEEFIQSRIQPVEHGPASKTATKRFSCKLQKKNGGSRYVDNLVQQAREEAGVV